MLVEARQALDQEATHMLWVGLVALLLWSVAAVTLRLLAWGEEHGV